MKSKKKKGRGQFWYHARNGTDAIREREEDELLVDELVVRELLACVVNIIAGLPSAQYTAQGRVVE
jgi:hypothetical protein